MRRLISLVKQRHEAICAIVIGLGNPGPEYAATRHNTGFWVCDELATRHGLRLRGSGRGEIRVTDRRVRLIKPQTWMNRSGLAVMPLIGAFHSGTALIVVHDDVDLEPGTIRLRSRGGSGGHQGVQSIMNVLGTDEFYRLRIGIGRPPAGTDTADWVLGVPDDIEMGLLRTIVRTAADALECIIAEDITAAMNRYNHN